MPRSFSDASWADGGNPSQIRRVQATTLPHEWVTILFLGRKDMPRLTRIMLGQQVGTAHGVPMRCKTTSRAPIHAPLGFITVQATTPIRQGARTGLTGIGLLDQANGNPRSFRLVGDGPALPSMRPEANLLLALRLHPLAIGHVAHIADDQRAYLALPGPGDDSTTDFVLQVPGAALLLRQEARLAALQPFPRARAFVLAILLGADRRDALGGGLLIGAQRPAANDARLVAIGERRGVDIAQVDRCRSGSWCGQGRHAILNDHMPAVVLSGAVPN